MNRRIMPFAAAMLLASTIPVQQAGAAGADPGLPRLPMPKALVLTDELTPVYDGPDGGKLYDAGPQFVKVDDAEDDWDRKLQENSAVWFEIETSGGRRWVNLRNPQFDESYYNNVLLTGDELIYASRTAQGKSLGTISPQTVRSIYSGDGDYLVQTWLGFRWIHPVHPAYEHAQQFYGPTTVALNAITPMFASPDAGGAVAGWLSPQYVTSSLAVNNEWFNIDTWLGKLWINPNIAYPQDLRKGDTTLTLTSPTEIYEHPNKKARVLGTLAPQTVDVYERGSGWHHIRSDWLADAWIYSADPELDPDVYVPPSQVAVKPLEAEWTDHSYDFGAGWRGEPFATAVSATGGGNAGPLGFIILPGEPVDIHFTIANNSDDDLTLAASTSFEIDILRYDGNDRNHPTLVWSGKLPPLTASFAKKERYIYSRELSYAWDQKDSDGKRVPFGQYRVELKTPANIDYTKTGASDPLRQKAEMSTRTAMVFTIGAP